MWLTMQESSGPRNYPVTCPKKDSTSPESGHHRVQAKEDPWTRTLRDLYCIAQSLTCCSGSLCCVGWVPSSRCPCHWGRMSFRPIQSHFSETTLTGPSPADAEMPQTSGQEGGQECSNPWKANLSLEMDRLAEGWVHGTILANTHQLEACILM